MCQNQMVEATMKLDEGDDRAQRPRIGGKLARMKDLDRKGTIKEFIAKMSGWR